MTFTSLAVADVTGELPVLIDFCTGDANTTDSALVVLTAPVNVSAGDESVASVVSE